MSDPGRGEIYSKDSDSAHLGPVAQDFKESFYPGRDEKHITTLEFDGVALAAIQGLNQKLEEQLKEKDASTQALQKEVSELKAIITRMVQAESLPKNGHQGVNIYGLWGQLDR